MPFSITNGLLVGLFLAVIGAALAITFVTAWTQPTFHTGSWSQWVRPVDLVQNDAFGRFKMGQSIPVWANMNVRPSHIYVMDDNSQDPGVSMTDGTGDQKGTIIIQASKRSGFVQATRQAYLYTPYVPGIAKNIQFTLIMNPPQFTAQVTKPAQAVTRAGMFDDENGIFIEFDKYTRKIAFCLRRNGAIAQRVEQDDFNINKLTDVKQYNIGGTLRIDWTKQQVMYIDQEYLGAGSVRLGIYVDNVLHFAHAFTHTNKLNGPYQPVPNGPMRYEAFCSNEVVSGNAAVVEGCSAIMFEGMLDVFVPVKLQFAYMSPARAIAAANTEVALLAFRANPTNSADPYNTGTRQSIQVLDMKISSSDKNVAINLRVYRFFQRSGVQYGTFTTDPTWSCAQSPFLSDNKYCRVQVATFTTGTQTGFDTTNTQLIDVSVNNESTQGASDVQLTLGASLQNVPDIYFMTVESTSNNYTVSAQLHWQEET